MPSTNRRLFLGAVGATLTGIAGCLGDTSPGANDEAPSDTTTESRTSTTTDQPTTAESTDSFSLLDSSVQTVGGVQVAVANVAAEKAISYQSIMGSGGVLAPENRQFVVAEVQSGRTPDASSDPEYDAFELIADGETYSAIEIEDRTTGAYTTSLAERGEIRYDNPYASRNTVGWIAFELPSPLDVNDAVIRCRYGGETVEWSLSDERVSALARPAPTFELRSFEATVRTASVELSLVAENVSEADGRFLAAVYWPTSGIADDDESTIVARSVAAGDRVEWTKSFGVEYSGGEDGIVTASVEGSVSDERTVDTGS